MYVVGPPDPRTHCGPTAVGARERKEIVPTRPTRALGPMDMHVTIVGLGAWAMVGEGCEHAWRPRDSAESVATILDAVAAGINWWTPPRFTDWGTWRRTSAPTWPSAMPARSGGNWRTDQIDAAHR